MGSGLPGMNASHLWTSAVRPRNFLIFGARGGGRGPIQLSSSVQFLVSQSSPSLGAYAAQSPGIVIGCTQIVAPGARFNSSCLSCADVNLFWLETRSQASRIQCQYPKCPLRNVVKASRCSVVMSSTATMNLVIVASHRQYLCLPLRPARRCRSASRERAGPVAVVYGELKLTVSPSGEGVISGHVARMARF